MRESADSFKTACQPVEGPRGSKATLKNKAVVIKCRLNPSIAKAI